MALTHLHIQHVFKHQTAYLMLVGALFFGVNNSILAISILMEAQRTNHEIGFAIWEPFCWEYSSALGIVLLLPCLAHFNDKYPFDWSKWQFSIGYYVVASVIFSLLHIGVMVVIREGIYAINGIDYDFLYNKPSLMHELLYEYHKDIWTFCICLIVINAFKFILQRLRGEAKLVAESEIETEVVAPQPPERLLVKKLGKEFVINVKDIQWLEAAGNYVNLHIDNRIYPIRSTLSKLSERITDKGFVRIHRSYAVNVHYIDLIEPLSNGDSEVKLLCGKRLNLSRRYKDDLKGRLQ